MSSNYNDIKSLNKKYSDEFGEKKNLPVPPIKKIAILTCMDSRLEPLRFSGLNLGDAHIIRNAGGRASNDAIRSLVISYKLLGTNEWYIIHHTDCGLNTFTNEEMGNLLENSLEQAKFENGKWVDVGKGPGSIEGKFINWLPYEDIKDSLIHDVKRIRNHPLVPKNITIYAFQFDVCTGQLVEIEEASVIGKPC